jgi:hypothetical protein
MGDGKSDLQGMGHSANGAISGSAYNGGPGWPCWLRKNAEFLIMIEAREIIQP